MQFAAFLVVLSCLAFPSYQDEIRRLDVKLDWRERKRLRLEREAAQEVSFRGDRSHWRFLSRGSELLPGKRRVYNDPSDLMQNSSIVNSVNGIGVLHDFGKRRDRHDSSLPFAVSSTSSENPSGKIVSTPWVASCYEKDCPHAWLDSDGQRIEAHGGAIIQDKNGKFYWFGESRKIIEPNKGYGFSVGVACYSSGALGGPWVNEGIVLSQNNIKDKELPEKERPLIIERPKVLYNSATERYVMWFHLDAATMLDEASLSVWQKKKKIAYKYSFRRAAVATSLSPTGPFKFIRSLLPDGEKSLDLQLHQESSGDAFLIRSVNNKFVGISKLTSDYLSTIGRTEMMVKPALEAVAMFRNPRDHALHAIASHLTGWEPNPLVFLKARRMSGKPCGIGCGLSENLKWDNLGNPTGEHNSFNTQPTFAMNMIDQNGNAYVMIMFDNWLRAGPRGLEDAGYIWLPFDFDADTGGRLQKLLNWTMQSPFGTRDQA